MKELSEKKTQRYKTESPLIAKTCKKRREKVKVTKGQLKNLRIEQTN